MSMMECTMCHKLADARSLHGCTSCGAMLCDDCSERDLGLCADCAAADGNS